MEHRVYPFEFSVIMAVYNVEPWLREAVDSLIAQDFGFENIQLIFVDDGSTDGSGMICDEYAARYPDNVLVIHKENGGLSSARNAGVRVSCGKYLSFFDPDDLLDRQIFSSVYEFFTAHHEDVDIVAVPMMLFGDQTGEHPANQKFKKGTRTIDLNKEWTAFHLSLATSFLRSDVAKQFCFKEDLIMATAEDAKEMLKLLLRNPKLGVVNNGYYHYRKRVGSQVSRSTQTPLGYIPYLRDFSQWAIDYSISQLGVVPKFVQNIVLYDLQWKIKATKLPTDILGEDGTAEYITCLKNVLSYIDDDVVMAQKNIFSEHKAWILEQKHRKQLQLLPKGKKVFLALGSKTYFDMTQGKTCLEFLNIRNSVCQLEGSLIVYPYRFEDVTVELSVNGKSYLGSLCDRNPKMIALGETVSRRIGYRVSFPVCREVEHYTIEIAVIVNGIKIKRNNLTLGKYFPISPRYKNAYTIQDNWCATIEKEKLVISSIGRRGHVSKELAFLKELREKHESDARKAIAVRILSMILQLFKKKQIWLICDKADRADDNGEAFFIYLRKLRPKGIKPYFLVGKDSPDYKKLRNYGKVLPYMSRRHKIWYFLADYTISAYSHDEINNPFYGYSEPYRDLLQHCKYIFLQHGIIKDDLSIGLNRYHKNIKRFVCSTVPERNSILETPAYGYSSEEIILTGLPRYDRLYHAEKNEIVIMPTWRRDLFGGYHSQNSQWDLKPGFPESDYYKFYNDLVNNERLLNAATAMGYTINFVPHPIFFPYIDMFSVPPEVKLWGGEVIYRQMFAENKLLITDFSSVAFDFAYLRKPVVYAHFDTNHYQEGYFDYERDGFGEVEYDLESTVNRIIEYMENGCQLKEKYRARIDGFFAFNDQNNCQRVYEKIMELDKGK